MIEIGIAADVISGVSASVLAVLACLVYRRFESRKWWERKCDAYKQILDALADTHAYYDREIRAADQLSEIPEDELAGLVEKYTNAVRDIQKAIDFAELFISNEARQRLVQYKNEMALTGQFSHDGEVYNSWAFHLAEGLDAIRTCQTDMIKITKKDLKLP